jgi:hypothetical protein
MPGPADVQATCVGVHLPSSGCHLHTCWLLNPVAAVLFLAPVVTLLGATAEGPGVPFAGASWLLNPAVAVPFLAPCVLLLGATAGGPFAGACCSLRALPMTAEPDRRLLGLFRLLVLLYLYNPKVSNSSNTAEHLPAADVRALICEWFITSAKLSCCAQQP